MWQASRSERTAAEPRATLTSVSQYSRVVATPDSRIASSQQSSRMRRRLRWTSHTTGWTHQAAHNATSIHDSHASPRHRCVSSWRRIASSSRDESRSDDWGRTIVGRIAPNAKGPATSLDRSKRTSFWVPMRVAHRRNDSKTGPGPNAVERATRLLTVSTRTATQPLMVAAPKMWIAKKSTFQSIREFAASVTTGTDSGGSAFKGPAGASRPTVERGAPSAWISMGSDGCDAKLLSDVPNLSDAESGSGTAVSSRGSAAGATAIWLNNPVGADQRGGTPNLSNAMTNSQ